MNAKKKMLYAALFVMLILWAATHQSPIQILVNFVVAGSLPGFDISLSPYVMFGLALVGGSALLAQLYLQNNDPTRVLVEAPAETLAPHSRGVKKSARKTQPRRKRTAAIKITAATKTSTTASTTPATRARHQRKQRTSHTRTAKTSARATRRK